MSTFFPFLIFFVVALTIRAILNWSYLKQADKCIKVYGDFFHERISSIDHIIPTLQELSQKAGIPFAEATSPIMAPSLIDPDLYLTIQYFSPDLMKPSALFIGFRLSFLLHKNFCYILTYLQQASSVSFFS